MPVYVSMLRGVNLGGHKKVKMEELRALYSALKLQSPQSYIQSGNVVFRANSSDAAALAGKIERAIEKKFGFQSKVLLRTTDEMRQVVATNPLRAREAEPSKLLVTFFHDHVAPETVKKLAAIECDEEIRVHGRELYIYFPTGIGRSEIRAVLERTLKATPGTARNWNSVLKLLEMAEGLEA